LQAHSCTHRIRRRDTGRTAVFDTSLQQAHEWLLALRGELGTSDEKSACAALRAALHVVRDALTIRQAIELGDCLPVLVRGIYYEGWHPESAVESGATPDNILRSARHAIRGHYELPSEEKILRAGFNALDRLLPRDEVQSVLNALPASVQRLWPRAEI
jgi:uncharacterized protein (DUF2267 family)